MHIHFLGTKSLLTASGNMLQMLFKVYKEQNRLSFLTNLSCPYFLPSSTLRSMIAFSAPLHSCPLAWTISSSTWITSSLPSPYFLVTLSLVTFSSTLEQHPSIIAAPRTLSSPRPALPLRQVSKSPFLNYRSGYFHLPTFASC